MNAISALFSGSQPQPWQKPRFEQPSPTKASDLTLLGTDSRGRDFYRYKGSELIERYAHVDGDRQVLPDGPIVPVDGQPGMWRTFDIVAPGSFEAAKAGKVRHIAPKPHRPVDSLAHLFTPRNTAVMRDGDHAVAPPSGPAAMLAALAKDGVQVALSTDGASLAVSTSGGSLAAGGRNVPDVLRLIDRAGALILAHLRGEPLTCTVTKHKTPQPAVSIALGGAPICADCLDGAA